MSILPFLLLLSGISVPQAQFLSLLLPLWVAIPRRVNALAFSRYSGLNEKTFRRWMRKALPWTRLHFTLLHILMGCGGIGRNFILTIDASFIPKSGRHTHGLGKFWNGCARRAENNCGGFTV